MNDAIQLGTREEWGQTSPVILSAADRRRHLYVIGQTGTGKSTLLDHLVAQDAAAGRGFAFIDPHGDSAEKALDAIPSSAARRVTYFDPSDPARAPAFNVLANVPPHRRHLAASGIVAAFKGVFPEFFGPRMEYIFYAAAAALLDCENVSLLSLARMLSDPQYRGWVVRQVKDPVVRNFWLHEFEAHDKRTQAEMVSPILNKIGPILMAPQGRAIVGQVKNRIDFRFMMDTGRIFVANLSKGKLGAELANLLGSLLVSQFQLAAMSRADTPEEERRDFHLYVDEFQSFTSESFASILSEARKYRLCLTISHQYMSQLKPGILDAILGNVGSIVSFRVGHDDAEALGGAFEKRFSPAAFTGLGNGEVYAKILTNGRYHEPFLARTAPPRPGNRIGGTTSRWSKQRYAPKRRRVEDRIRRSLGHR